jgi:NAD-dependent deacetylase
MDKPSIPEFKQKVGSTGHILGFTGAGISSESGIPDYRSKGGIWQRFQPVYFDEFLRDEDKRILYWKRKLDQWESISSARPNSGHFFFSRLYENGLLTGMITQNIDGLHEKSGLPGEILVNIHGCTLEIACLSCGLIVSAQDFYPGLDLDRSAPRCGKCGGLLKPNTISFGQQLNAGDIEKANELASKCSLMIVMGSTLLVQPAASFPLIAKKNGAELAIVNLTETPLDEIADYVFNMKISDFLEIYEGRD